MKTIQKNKLLIFILFVGTILRFYNLAWDWGLYLHPDERLYINASNLHVPSSINEFFSPTSPLNPHMFYYGSFPLYLYKIITAVFLPHLDLLLVSRMISAMFSSITLIIIYLLARDCFSQKIAVIASFIFAFVPGSIQYAHFNTTESLLIFFLTVLCYLSVKFYHSERMSYGYSLGIFWGLAYATKIVGLTFGLFPLISYLLLYYYKRRNVKDLILSFIAFILCGIFIGFMMAPYQVIDFTNFLKEQSYMQAVTYGKFKPPFVIIYEGSIPYLYQISKVFPYTFGLVGFFFASMGLFLLLKEKKIHIFLYFILFPLAYFLWSGLWFAKFSRYYVLLIPFLSIYAAFALSKISPFIRNIALFFIALQGLFFFHIYFFPNTRVSASEWIYRTFPNNTIIATEHWDDALPLNLPNSISPSHFTNLSMSVYDPDSEAKITTLSGIIARSDYIILSSRRVYLSILQNQDIYPYTSEFYKQLFSENLGYIKITEFTRYPYLFSDDFADESFQSYDHPPVVIYKNVKHLGEKEIGSIILNEEK